MPHHKRWIILLLMIAIAAGPCFPAALADEVPSGYVFAASSGIWELYVNEGNLAIALKERSTGKILYSVVDDAGHMRDNDAWKAFYQSSIVMEYIVDNVAKYETAVLLNTPHSLSLEYEDNGFSAAVDYSEIGISFTVQVCLLEDRLVVSIPQKTIVEKAPQKYAVAGFYVYPFMGYNYNMEHDGFLLIPDGQGAIIPFGQEQRTASPYKKTVYGPNIGFDAQKTASADELIRWTDAEKVIAPFYGMIHEDEEIGFLAVIEQGDTAATIYAYPNGASRLSFDWITARYAYRDVYMWKSGESASAVNRRTAKPRDFDIRVSFLLAAGRDATLSGLARKYRNLLSERGGFEGADDRPFDIQVDCICMDKKNGLFGKTPVVVTTARQAGEIIKQIAGDRGIPLTFTMLGWQKNGLHSGMPVLSFEKDTAVGTRKDFDDLLELANKLDVSVYYDYNPVRVNTGGGFLLTYKTMQKVDGRDCLVYTNGIVSKSYQYLAPHITLEYVKKMCDDSMQAAPCGIMLSGLPALLTDYLYRGVYYSSCDTANAYLEAAKLLRERSRLGLRASNAYLWPYADILCDLPLEGSYYTYASEAVPFISMALSGQIPLYSAYINLYSDQNTCLLRLAEQGIRPAFLVTREEASDLQLTDARDMCAATFSQYESTICGFYDRLKPLHDLTDGAAICDRTSENGHVIVTYENGIRVLVNYTDKPWNCCGTVIPGNDFAMISEE